MFCYACGTFTHGEGKAEKSLQNMDTETGNMPKMLSNVMTIALCTKMLSYLGKVTRMVVHPAH